ncbi:MAG: phosphate ABC transporter permease subunit PstC [Candidatus Competibacterales bacterium]
MSLSTLVVIILALCAFSYFLGRRRSLQSVDGKARQLHSLPSYYGFYVALWCGIPALLLVLVWVSFQSTVAMELVVNEMTEEERALSEGELALRLNSIRNLASTGLPVFHEPCYDNTSAAYNTQACGLERSYLDINCNRSDSERYDQPACLDQRSLAAAAERFVGYNDIGRAALVVCALVIAILGALYTLRSIAPRLRARNRVEGIVKAFLIISSTLAIFTTLGIVLSVLFESYRFFQSVNALEFLFGLQWSPQIAIRADQTGSSGAFGAVPLFAGTLLISAIAMAVAVPIGLLSAIYLSEYASARVRSVAKPMLEILAGIPTVVYGFFAALTMAPLIRDIGESMGLDVASESALAAGLVMGIMIIPFVSSLSDDVIHAVPKAMRDGSFGLGATHAETIKRVILPAALPGIVGSVLLAISRAVGETMIVVMAAGLAANLTGNTLEAVTTVTVQIVTLLTGDQEFDTPKTLAAFALGLTLFVVTLTLNVIALQVVKKYREQYE